MIYANDSGEFVALQTFEEKEQPDDEKESTASSPNGILLFIFGGILFLLLVISPPVVEVPDKWVRIIILNGLQPTAPMTVVNLMVKLTKSNDAAKPNDATCKLYATSNAASSEYGTNGHSKHDYSSQAMHGVWRNQSSRR